MVCRFSTTISSGGRLPLALPNWAPGSRLHVSTLEFLRTLRTTTQYKRLTLATTSRPCRRRCRSPRRPRTKTPRRSVTRKAPHARNPVSIGGHREGACSPHRLARYDGERQSSRLELNRRAHRQVRHTQKGPTAVNDERSMGTAWDLLHSAEAARSSARAADHFRGRSEPSPANRC